MKKKRLEGIFEATNSLKVFSFLARNPSQEFLSSEIQIAVLVSRAGAYLALQDLLRERLIIKAEKGRFHLYSLNHDNPIVRQFKVLMNVILLEPLILKLRPFMVRMVLFGSASRGEDTASSDIDLFILSKDPETIREHLTSYKAERKLQPIVLAPAEWPE
ncbi:MAG: nucleotidyltransferase domain-containing protein, partial [Candidatus Aminicenantes bacterium]|nr:nucleotidyltransferase domain-containing protein [Candidatus Aminicenantes bacterium]